MMSDFEQDNMFHGEGVFRTFQRLYQSSRAHVSSVLTQRSANTFTTHADPVPTEAWASVSLLVYPQDPLSYEPQIRTLDVADVQAGLLNSRFRVESSRGVVATPDEDGNYFYAPHTPEFSLVNAFYYATFTLRMFERYANRAIQWAFPSPRLRIDPHVGDAGSAFYNEQDRLIGFHSYKTADGTMSNTADSADIVSHETAHAVLDGLRDLWNESFGLGTRAFHESFGDIAAVLVALHDDTLVQRTLAWTDGDLRRSNVISELAEHLARNLAEGMPQRDPKHTIYLRNALNALKNAPFDSLDYLPKDPELTLARQEHNYSRLFTGAFYEILVGVYEELCTHHSPYVALHKARDVMGYLLVMAVELAPIGELDFSDMACAFLTADKVLYEGKHHPVMIRVFSERLLLSQLACETHLNSLAQLPEVRLPQTLNNALSVALFLEKTLLPVLHLPITEDLFPFSTYRNSEGYCFMTFFSVRQIKLSGKEYKEYDGVLVDSFGGLTVAFTPDDRLFSVVYRPVTAEDERQIRITIADLIAYGRISTRIHDYDETPTPTPKGLYIRPMGSTQDGVLVKYPIVFDAIPPKMSSFVDYLMRWRKS